jgi:hypothetical protein
VTIKVERCWGGHRFHYRLTLPDGRRETILDPDETGWTRTKEKIMSMNITEKSNTWKLQDRSITNLKTGEMRLLQAPAPFGVAGHESLEEFQLNCRIAFDTGYYPGTRRCPCCESIIR